jgi:serine/threonine-protein kinase
VDREPDAESLVGAVIASRYLIEAQIGDGAMGRVYRARHVKLGRLFAVKVLRPSLLADATICRRFTREAELAAALQHPNIVTMVDVGETPGGLHYLVMEHAPGDTLYDLIVREAPMPAARVIGIVRQLCDGLGHAHDRGLIHRDFKPDNVIVERERDGDPLKIVDFGIAILRDEAASSSPERLTTVGVVLGTPHYMAPEQALGQPIDPRADLFALGVMCFEMLTGRPPFDGDGVDIARANIMLETPAMRDRAPDHAVDPLLEAFTRRLMMKSPDARPPSAAAARTVLDLIAHDRAAAAAVLDIALPPEPAPLPLPLPGVDRPVGLPIEPGSMYAAAGPRPGGSVTLRTSVPPPPDAPFAMPTETEPRSPAPFAGHEAPPMTAELAAPYRRRNAEPTERLAPMRPRRGAIAVTAVAMVAALVVIAALVVAARTRDRMAPRRPPAHSLGVADPQLEGVLAGRLARDPREAHGQLAAEAVERDDPRAGARGGEPLLDPPQRALDRRVAHERAGVRREHQGGERVVEVERVELVPR